MEEKYRAMQKKSLRKYQVLAVGAFAIFFTGFPHIWSIYQPYVLEYTGWSKEQTSLCFYIYFVVFVFGNILGGRLQDRYSPRMPVLIGGGIFTLSLFLSAFGFRSSPIFLYVTYGILQGVGQGMIYSTIISTAQKWYPEKPGFASGVIVTANGLFGFFMAPVCRNLLESVGLKGNFLVMGTLVGISWLFSRWLIDNPPDMEKGEKVLETDKIDFRPSKMLHSREFYLLTVTMLFGLIPYMLVSPVAQIIQTDRGVADAVAVAAVMGGSVCNAIARLAVPSIADRAGRISSLSAVLGVLVFSMVALTVAPRALVSPAVILLYGCYGGIMGSFPALTSCIFGMKHSGENYGYVLLGLAAATFSAPLITRVVYRVSLTEEVLFFVGAASGLAALLTLFVLSRRLGREV